MDSGKMIRDNDVGGMCSVLHIDVLLDSRYYGRACLVDSHELEQRFGCLVELQTHLLEGR